MGSCDGRGPLKRQDSTAQEARFAFIGNRCGAFSLLAVIAIVDEMPAGQELLYGVFALHPLGEVWRELSRLWTELREASQAERTQVVPCLQMDEIFDVERHGRVNVTYDILPHGLTTFLGRESQKERIPCIDR